MHICIVRTFASWPNKYTNADFLYHPASVHIAAAFLPGDSPSYLWVFGTFWQQLPFFCLDISSGVSWKIFLFPVFGFSNLPLLCCGSSNNYFCILLGYFFHGFSGRSSKWKASAYIFSPIFFFFSKLKSIFCLWFIESVRWKCTYVVAFFLFIHFHCFNYWESYL